MGENLQEWFFTFVCLSAEHPNVPTYNLVMNLLIPESALAEAVYKYLKEKEG